MPSQCQAKRVLIRHVVASIRERGRFLINAGYLDIFSGYVLPLLWRQQDDANDAAFHQWRPDLAPVAMSIFGVGLAGGKAVGKEKRTNRHVSVDYRVVRPAGLILDRATPSPINLRPILAEGRMLTIFRKIGHIRRRRTRGRIEIRDTVRVHVNQVEPRDAGGVSPF